MWLIFFFWIYVDYLPLLDYIQFLLFSNRKELCLQCPYLTFNYKQTHLSPLNCVLIPFWFEKWEIIPIFGINRRECLWGWVIFCHEAWETVLAMKKNFLRPSIVEHWLQGNAGTEDGIREQGAEKWGCLQHDGQRLRTPAENARIPLLLSWASYLNLLVSQVFTFEIEMITVSTTKGYSKDWINYFMYQGDSKY